MVTEQSDQWILDGLNFEEEQEVQAIGLNQDLEKT
jgi:hypothetical protein